MDWHKQAVGGLWEELGTLQFEFLVAQGLQPSDKLLDVGCGSLRGGLHFIPYMDRAHYTGIDISEELLKAGEAELRNAGLESKEPRLVHMGRFEFSSLGTTFDFALAQSVFTHLPLNSVISCIMNIDQVLVSGGRFFATFFENPRGKFDLGPLSHDTSNGALYTYFDQDPYHYDFPTFEWACAGTGLRVELIGDWDHPRDQRMLAFTKQ